MADSKKVDEGGIYPTRVSTLEATAERQNARISVVESQIEALSRVMDDRLKSMEKATALALTAAEKTTAIAQSTADKAVAKAEAAAGKEYLESQIEGLRNSITAQITSQKEALNAALTAAKEALTAALASSEKAISKQETAIQERFEKVNEFRAQLDDQAKTFVRKSESDIKFGAVEKEIDESNRWRRTVDLKFGDYVTSSLYHSVLAEWTGWRRTVEAALTAASSKSGLIYAIMAMAIAAGGLLLAIFNLFSKVPLS